MIIISRSKFPKKCVKEAAQIFTELKPLPASIKKNGPYFSFDEDDVINVITFYRFEGESPQEIHKYIISRHKYFAGIDGFSYSLEFWHNMKEALQELAKPAS